MKNWFELLAVRSAIRIDDREAGQQMDSWACYPVIAFLEYEAVLKRPEQRPAYGLGLRDIDRFLAAFAAASKAVEMSFQWPPQLSGANDEMVLEAAVNGRADALITNNVRDFAKGAKKVRVTRFRPRRVLEGVTIMSEASYPLKLPASVKAAVSRQGKARSAAGWG